MIAVIDYGMGNLHSVAKALEYVGKSSAKVKLVRNGDELRDAERIVLPGVGAFRDCMRGLEQNGLAEAIVERIRAGVPYLGICLGMQVLLDESLEFGRHKGLGIITGKVKSFPETHPQRGFKIPHMGWNDTVCSSQCSAHPVLAAMAGKQTYFVHSFFCVPDDSKHILAACSYGDYPFAAAIGYDNVLAVQFHPEKSQAAGLALLEAFIQWQP
ncbi:MAG: imidazole glycerol phosphate synthase subunit HisH [Mariprofundales bacterium]